MNRKLLAALCIATAAVLVPPVVQGSAQATGVNADPSDQVRFEVKSAHPGNPKLGNQ